MIRRMRGDQDRVAGLQQEVRVSDREITVAPEQEQDRIFQTVGPGLLKACGVMGSASPFDDIHDRTSVSRYSSA